jgi:hypothetical protein
LSSSKKVPFNTTPLKIVFLLFVLTMPIFPTRGPWTIRGYMIVSLGVCTIHYPTKQQILITQLISSPNYLLLKILFFFCPFNHCSSLIIVKEVNIFKLRILNLVLENVEDTKWVISSRKSIRWTNNTQKKRRKKAKHYTYEP